jgi:hypothetical protein
MIPVMLLPVPVFTRTTLSLAMMVMLVLCKIIVTKEPVFLDVVGSAMMRTHVPMTHAIHIVENVLTLIMLHLVLITMLVPAMMFVVMELAFLVLPKIAMMETRVLMTHVML